MPERRTTPSDATRDEERRDARVEAGPDEVDEEAATRADAPLDPEVAEHYEEMSERGAAQRGEGRLP